MKPVEPHERVVANIATVPFEPFLVDGVPLDGQTILQLDDTFPKGVGFHIYRMAPGTASQPHEHTCHEQFLVLDGELIENDGTVYRAGDLVLLKKGSQHNSRTETGCTLAVFISSIERNL